MKLGVRLATAQEYPICRQTPAARRVASPASAPSPATRVSRPVPSCQFCHTTTAAASPTTCYLPACAAACRRPPPPAWKYSCHSFCGFDGSSSWGHHDLELPTLVHRAAPAPVRVVGWDGHDHSNAHVAMTLRHEGRP